MNIDTQTLVAIGAAATKIAALQKTNEELRAALQMAKKFIPSPMEGCDCPSCKVFEVIDAVLQRTEP